jgi:thioesterase domain-containing protein
MPLIGIEWTDLPEKSSEHLKWLQRRIETLIPLTRKTGFLIDELSPEHITLFVPLSPNVNDKSTLFGGVSSLLLTLAGWSLISYRFRCEGVDAQLVVAKTETQYTAPMRSSGAKVTLRLEEKSFQNFLERVKKGDRARIDVLVEEFDLEEQRCAWQSASYVALPSESAEA